MTETATSCVVSACQSSVGRQLAAVAMCLLVLEVCGLKRDNPRPPAVTVAVTSSHVVSRRSSPTMVVRKSVAAVAGSSRVLECDVRSPTTSKIYVEQIITWRKQGTEVPIFIQFNGFPPHIDAGFQGRVRLVDRASIEIRGLIPVDEGWYQCSIVFLDGGGSDRNSVNGTSIYVSVNVPPSLIKTPPKIISVKEHSATPLVCEGQGRPQPEITWFKDGTELLLGVNSSVEVSQVTSNGSSLTIGSDEEDGSYQVVSTLRAMEPGHYTCLVKNVAGHVSHNTSLFVEGRAYITVSPSNTTVRERSSVVLDCHARGLPNNITYQWYLNGVNVQLTAPSPSHFHGDLHDNGQAARTVIYPDGSLAITDLHRSDSGWYSCRPSNGPGRVPVEARAYLNITYLPTHLPRSGLVAATTTSMTSSTSSSSSSPLTGSSPQQVLYLPRGLLGRIDCPVDANPPVTLTVWSKNDRVVDVTKSTRFTVNARGTLIIKPVSTGDEGRYACTPYSSLGPGTMSSSVNVIVRDPPYFVIRPQLFYQRELTQSVVIPCAVRGDPAPNIVWRKVDSVMPPYTRSIQDAGNLTISDIRREDHGKYECVAANVVTRVISTTFLIVELTSSHAAYNVTVEPSSNSIRVSWYPAYDGGFPHHYIIWYREEFESTSDWQTVRVISNETFAMTIYGLRALTSYHVIVMSRDRSGRDQFSQTISTTTLPLRSSDVIGRSAGGTTIVIQQTPSGGNIASAGHVGAVIEQPPSDMETDYESIIEDRRPPAPVNVSVKQQRTGLLLTWLPPPSPTRHWPEPPGSVPVVSPVHQHHGDSVAGYLIQYRTVGRWVDLTSDRLPPDRTWYEWKTASRGASYQFRVLSYGADGQYSQPSPTLSFRTGDPKPAGDGNVSESLMAIVGGSTAAILLCVIVVCAAVRVLRRARKRRQRFKRDLCLQHETVKFYHAPQTDASERLSSKGTSVTILETQTLSAVNATV